MKSATELADFGDLHNFRFGGARRSSEAVLFLHGFPAEQSNKNVDIAWLLSETFSTDVYLLHYAGLGKSGGDFTFQGAIADSIAYAQNLISLYDYRRIHIVGHSWGAWVAMNVFAALSEKRGAMALLAPFCSFPDEHGPRELALYFLRLHPHIFPSDRWESVSADLTQIQENRNPLALAPSLPSERILVVRAIDDDVISDASVRKLIDAFVEPPAYLEIKSDHRFVHNRQLLCDALIRFFSRNISQDPQRR